MNEGDELMTVGDTAAAVAAYAAAEAMVPDNHEMIFWHAATLAAAGELEQALPLFRRAFAAWPKWRDVVARLPASGLLPNDPALLARILAE
jgi:tetratricopeptide (TPR) repeat protein